MRTIALSPLIISTLFSSAIVLSSVDARGDSSQFHGYLAGNYLLIGKAPDSDETYHGSLMIQESDDGTLGITKHIAGKVINGKGGVEHTVMAEAQVLRIRFSEGGIDHEQTCLWRGDLNNYARISCYLYREDGTTQQPGLEALFHSRQSPYDD